MAVQKQQRTEVYVVHRPVGLYVALGLLYIGSIICVIVMWCCCQFFEPDDTNWVIIVCVCVPFVSFIVVIIMKKCCYSGYEKEGYKKDNQYTLQREYV